MLAADSEGGGGGPFTGRTQREVMAVIGSPDHQLMDRTETMWRDTAAAAREIAGLVQQRLDRLVGPQGWQGAGAEAYKEGVQRELLDRLTEYAQTAEQHAEDLKPINQAVSGSLGTAMVNDIPWDREAKWAVTRKDVDQSMFGKVDEFVTGKDENYEKATSEAPYLVVDGHRAEKKSVEHTRWESLLKAYPQPAQAPEIFPQTNTQVTPDVHRFDELMEALGINSDQHRAVTGSAGEVGRAMDQYAPEAMPGHQEQGRLTSELEGAAGGAAPDSQTPEGTQAADLGSGGTPGAGTPGGAGGAGGPAGSGAPGASGPGAGGPGGTAAGQAPGATAPGQGAASPGLGAGPIGSGPGGSGNRAPGGGDGAPPAPIGTGPMGPGGAGVNGKDPADLSNSLPTPGTSTAGMDTTPGSAVRLTNVGSSLPGGGSSPAGAAVSTGSGMLPLGGTLAPGGGAGGRPASGAGRAGAGSGAPTPRSGVSLSMGPGGRPVVNPGSVGPLAGPGGGAGGGAPMSGMGMPMSGKNTKKSEESRYEYNSWLEEDEEVWNESAKDQAS